MGVITGIKDFLSLNSVFLDTWSGAEKELSDAELGRIFNLEDGRELVTDGISFNRCWPLSQIEFWSAAPFFASTKISMLSYK